MGILDAIFGGQPETPPATPPVTSPVDPGNLPKAGDASPTPPEGQVTTPEIPVSPLDEHKSLWEPVPIDKDAPPAEPVALDPAKLQEIIAKADFTKTLKPETLNLIAAGGEGAQAAFQESLNSVAQQVLMQSTLASNQMITQQVEAALAAQTKNLPDLIRQQTLSNNLVKANPIYANPAIAPVIDAVKSQLSVKNPDATADQLTEMAQNFVTVMAEQLTPKTTPSETVNGSANVDWGNFLK